MSVPPVFLYRGISTDDLTYMGTDHDVVNDSCPEEDDGYWCPINVTKEDDYVTEDDDDVTQDNDYVSKEADDISPDTAFVILNSDDVTREDNNEEDTAIRKNGDVTIISDLEVDCSLTSVAIEMTHVHHKSRKLLSGDAVNGNLSQVEPCYSLDSETEDLAISPPTNIVIPNRRDIVALAKPLDWTGSRTVCNSSRDVIGNHFEGNHSGSITLYLKQMDIYNARENGSCSVAVKTADTMDLPSEELTDSGLVSDSLDILPLASVDNGILQRNSEESAEQNVTVMTDQQTRNFGNPRAEPLDPLPYSATTGANTKMNTLPPTIKNASQHEHKRTNFRNKDQVKRGGSAFYCVACDAGFSTKRQLARHVDTSHNRVTSDTGIPKLYHCGICRRSNVMCPTSVLCHTEICRKVFGEEPRTAEILTDTTNDQGVYSSKGAQSTTKDKFARERALVGTPCNICGVVFHDTRQPKLHIWRHERIDRKNGQEKPFRCTHCKEVYFGDEKSLITHEQKLHGIVKNKYRGTRCKICGEVSIVPKKHKLIHEKIDPWTGVLKEFQCNICRDAYFTRKGQLDRHIAACHPDVQESIDA